jgi:SAM-dependent methyltransferase
LRQHCRNTRTTKGNVIGLHPLLAENLVSPGTHCRLRWSRATAAATEELIGPGGERFPIVDEIPRFTNDEGYVESFGFQWTAFNVCQEDDASVLGSRLGMPLNALNGLLVLDAGCGGGRYSRVAAEHGARVIAVDRSRAVEKARSLCQSFPNAAFVQADVTDLPFAPNTFDVVFSIGVLHHSPDPEKAFRAIASVVKPGGRLSVWVYRRNFCWQERLNSLARRLLRKLPRRALLAVCRAAGVLGGIPIVNRTLNKVVNFSNHPVWENRVCDNFDWYAPEFQHHHSPDEVRGWFEANGFVATHELFPPRQSRFYRRLLEAGWIIGSGVNMTATRTP